MIYHRFGHFLYVDEDPRANLAPVRVEKVWAGRCDACGGTHLLSVLSWPGCSNPDCLGHHVPAVVKPLLSGADVLVAAYAIGGAEAVLEVLAQEVPAAWAIGR